ncbi:MAG TPA: GNAT family N-acetyltransferase [Solirubrobacteraceae bacterium]|nr:GNAT family N-acetyltransferase [Solirubrobacteraceae bacterium]
MIDSPSSTPEAEFERRRTARLLLRRPGPADLDWMTALHSDPLNYEHAPDRAHEPQQARSLSQSLLDAWEADHVGYWIAEPAAAIDGVPNGRIGMAGVRPSSLAGRGCFNLYFRFIAAVRGRGFATEACREALAVAAILDPSCPVVVRTRASNVPAQRLAMALGLVRRSDLDALTTGYVVYVSDW